MGLPGVRAGPLQCIPKGFCTSMTSPGRSSTPLAVVRYRGFVLIPQADLSWLVRPERSPMRVLPFRTPTSSLADVKALVDWRLDCRAS